MEALKDLGDLMLTLSGLGVLIDWAGRDNVERFGLRLSRLMARYALVPTLKRLSDFLVAGIKGGVWVLTAGFRGAESGDDVMHGLFARSNTLFILAPLVGLVAWGQTAYYCYRFVNEIGWSLHLLWFAPTSLLFFGVLNWVFFLVAFYSIFLQAALLLALLGTPLLFICRLVVPLLEKKGLYRPLTSLNALMFVGGLALKYGTS